MRIFLQKSVPIQPNTSNILPKFCPIRYHAERRPERRRRRRVAEDFRRWLKKRAGEWAAAAAAPGETVETASPADYV